MKTNHHFNSEAGTEENVERITKKVIGENRQILHGLKLPVLVRACCHAFGIIPVEIWFQSSVAKSDLHHYF